MVQNRMNAKMILIVKRKGSYQFKRPFLEEKEEEEEEAMEVWNGQYDDEEGVAGMIMLFVKRGEGFVCFG